MMQIEVPVMLNLKEASMPMNNTVLEDCTAAVAKDAIVQFLRRLGVVLRPSFGNNRDLEERVKAITKTWPFEHRIHPHITTGVVMANTTIAYLSDLDARAAVAAYTALITALDDPDIFHASGAQNFAQMLCDGSALRDDGVLGQMGRVLADMGNHFPPFGTSAIIAATLRWCNGELISNPANPFCLRPLSKAFADYQRGLTGVSEAYAAFGWCKADFPVETDYIHVFPDICFFLNHTNDILSFYKETLDGESDSYIHARARLTGKSVTDTLYEVMDEVITTTERIRKHFGEGRMRDAWDRYEAGYVWFHTGNPRYRLHELVDTEYMPMY